ncbi:MAG: hypothetical protein V4472_25035 [Pseudomonadota bacterium]
MAALAFLVAVIISGALCLLWGIEEGGESLADKIQQEINLVGGQLSTIDESRIRLGWEPPEALGAPGPRWPKSG